MMGAGLEKPLEKVVFPVTDSSSVARKSSSQDSAEENLFRKY